MGGPCGERKLTGSSTRYANPHGSALHDWRRGAVDYRMYWSIAMNAISQPITSHEQVLRDIYAILSNHFSPVHHAIPKGMNSHAHELYERVRYYIVKAGKHGMTECELSKYIRGFRAADPTLRNQIFDLVRKEGVADLIPVKSRGGVGRKRKAWVVI